MIVSATVDGFRGLRRLEVGGFGRVNLIIGKNDCGKTALMEALVLAETGENSPHAALQFQQLRSPQVDPSSFDQCWRTLFWNQDADAGFAIKVVDSDRGSMGVAFREPSTSSRAANGVPAKDLLRGDAWQLEVDASIGEHQDLVVVRGGVDELKLLPRSATGPGWVSPRSDVDKTDLKLFSALKQRGADQRLLEILQVIDARVGGVEILAPTGDHAELYVRFADYADLLPMRFMGDGFQRGFEIGVCSVAYSWPFVFIDEFDNGLHHSVLEPVWSWLAKISTTRNLQVFATTHSDECIFAAARAFAALNDDGLRVIRLDRRDDRTTAAVYPSDLVATVESSGIEIRG